MRNLKTILPMLAFVLAIGMSFAFVSVNDDPATDYIFRNDSFEPINTELNCGVGTDACEVQYEGQVYRVYDDDNFSSAKEGDGNLIILSE